MIYVICLLVFCMHMVFIINEGTYVIHRAPWTSVMQTKRKQEAKDSKRSTVTCPSWVALRPWIFWYHGTSLRDSFSPSAVSVMPCLPLLQDQIESVGIWVQTSSVRPHHRISTQTPCFFHHQTVSGGQMLRRETCLFYKVRRVFRIDQLLRRLDVMGEGRRRRIGGELRVCL